MNYYNDIDPYCTEWLDNLIIAGELPDGDTSQLDIYSVSPNDLEKYNQCHFFAGIGGWPLALKLAGVPEDMKLWTGSCPCQPFSACRPKKGINDERHLWPRWCELISESHPPVIFGEQVATKDGRIWLDGVRSDLEKLGNAVGAADLCFTGTPHVRQRIYWVAHSLRTRLERGTWGKVSVEEPCKGFDVIQLVNGEYRRISSESSDVPLAHGVSQKLGREFPWLGRMVLSTASRNHIGRIKGYGNAIIPQLAANFIIAALEAI